jgi:hypothetical protein
VIAICADENRAEPRDDVGKKCVMGCFCSSAILVEGSSPLGMQPLASDGARWEAVIAEFRQHFDTTTAATSQSGQAVAARCEGTCGASQRGSTRKRPNSSRVSLSIRFSGRVWGAPQASGTSTQARTATG